MPAACRMRIQKKAAAAVVCDPGGYPGQMGDQNNNGKGQKCFQHVLMGPKGTLDPIPHAPLIGRAGEVSVILRL